MQVAFKAMRFPTPQDLKNELILSSSISDWIANSRKTASSILTREDKRIALILGPCSIHDIDQAIEYGEKLKELAKSTPHFFLIMRVFLEKPRTLGGWKGLVYDPNLDGSHNIQLGLKNGRTLLIELCKMGIPCCSEILDPLVAPYLSDLLTWGMIGARTSASQPHRQIASGLPFPIGFKNDVYGELDSAISAILSSRHPQTYLGLDQSGHIAIQKSQGNPSTHLVLRGGKYGPNFNAESISQAREALKAHFLGPHLLIDCSHGNSGKDHKVQPEVFKSVIEQIIQGDESIAGLMLESHLYAGKQTLKASRDTLKYGLSVTDACMGWEETQSLILEADRRLSKAIHK